MVDCLTFPIATGQEETRRDGIETIEAIRELKRRHPDVHTTLGVSNVSFGLNPAARQVLNSVFLAECTAAGLDSAIVHAVEDPADGPDPGGAADRRPGPGLRPAARGLRPAAAGAGAVRRRDHRGRPGDQGRRAAALPLDERLQAADHRRRAQRAGGRPGRGDAAAAAAGDHQRHPAGGHEDGRRAVRLRRRCSCRSCCSLGRGDEAGGRLPGAAHGEGRRGRQGHHRAGHRQGRRARHRQEPGRHHPVQQRLLRGELGIKQPISTILDGRAGAPAPTPSGCPGCWSSRR